VDLLIISGRKREGELINFIRIPDWIKSWAEHIGFFEVYSNDFQCIVKRKE